MEGIDSPLGRAKKIKSPGLTSSGLQNFKSVIPLN